MHESVNMVPIRKKEGPIMSTKNVIFSNPGDVIDFVNDRKDRRKISF